MEEISPNGNTAADSSACLGCGNPNSESGYATKLCTDCRNKYSKYPIPKWILFFASVVGVLVLSGFANIYKPLMASIHLTRSIKAQQSRKYKTAAAEIDKTLALYPESVEANARAIIYYYNIPDPQKMGRYYLKIEHKHSEDKKLITEVKEALDGYAQFIPKDTALISKVQSLPLDSTAAFEEVMRNYLAHDSLDMAATSLFADRLYDMKQYERAETLLSHALVFRPDYYPAQILLCSTKRQLGKYDEALKICDKLLELNLENTAVISQKARIELKRKNDAAAARYVKQAMDIDKNDINVLETLAMLDYYSNKMAESQKLLAQIKTIEQQDQYGDFVSIRLQNFLSGKDPFR